MNFRSDNEVGAHPSIIEAVSRAFSRRHRPFLRRRRLDAAASSSRLRELFDKPDLVAFPVATGTAANAWRWPAARRPGARSSAIPTAHIAVDETNAPEFFTGGARLFRIDGPAGKIDPAKLAAGAGPAGLRRGASSAARRRQHHAGDRMRHRLCARGDRRDRHLDASPRAEAAHGRRALRQCAVLRRLLAGRAVVEGGRRRAELRRHQERRDGGRGRGLLRCRAGRATSSSAASAAAICFSKMRLLSAQLDAYLADGAVARQCAPRQRHGAPAGGRADAAQGHAALLYPVDANEIFVVLPAHMHDALQAGGAQYHPWPSDRPGERAFRLVTAFDTDPADVDRFLSIAKASVEFPMTHQRTLTAAHWGVYEVEYDDNGQAMRAASLLEGSRSLADRPAHAVRRGGAAARAPAGGAQELAREAARAPAPSGAARSRSSKLTWDEALDLVAAELKRVKDTHSQPRDLRRLLRLVERRPLPSRAEPGPPLPECDRRLRAPRRIPTAWAPRAC